MLLHSFGIRCYYINPLGGWRVSTTCVFLTFEDPMGHAVGDFGIDEHSWSGIGLDDMYTCNGGRKKE